MDASPGASAGYRKADDARATAAGAHHTSVHEYADGVLSYRVAWMTRLSIGYLHTVTLRIRTKRVRHVMVVRICRPSQTQGGGLSVMHGRRTDRVPALIARTALGVLGILLMLALPHRAHATTLIVEDRSSVTTGDRRVDKGIDVHPGSSALYGTLAPGEDRDAYSFVAPASGTIAAALLVNTLPDSSDIRIRLSLASAEGTLTATGDVPTAYAERFDVNALDSQRGVAYERFDILGGKTYTIVVDSETFSPVTVPYVITLEAPMTWPAAESSALEPVARLWSGAYAQRPIRAIPVAVAVVVLGFLAIALSGVAMVAVQSLRRRRAGNLPAGPPRTRDDAPLLAPVLITPGREVGVPEAPGVEEAARAAEESEAATTAETAKEASVPGEPQDLEVPVEPEPEMVEDAAEPEEQPAAEEPGGPEPGEAPEPERADEPEPPAILAAPQAEDLASVPDEPKESEAAHDETPATRERVSLMGHLRPRRHRDSDAGRVALDARISPYASADAAEQDEVDA